MFLEEEEEGPESSLSYTREGKAGEDTVFIDGWMDGWMNESLLDCTQTLSLGQLSG